MLKTFKGMLTWYLMGTAAICLTSESAHSISDYYQEQREERIVNAVRAAPMTDWIEYTKVTPNKEVFNFGEELEMISYLYVRQPVDITWYDNLRCKPNPNAPNYSYVSISVTSSKLDVVDPTKLKESHWTYPFPTSGLNIAHGECIIVHTIEVAIDTGYQIVFKRQQLRSGPFIIKPP